MLGWVKQFNIFCFLDNQHYAIEPHQYECLLAAGVTSSVASLEVKQVDRFLEQHSSNWVFGHLSYELKDVLHFPSQKNNRVGFPHFHFFVPQFLLAIKNKELFIIADNPDELYKALEQQPLIQETPPSSLSIQQHLTREQYIRKIEALQAHIRRGDCYEINFCQEFFSEAAVIDPFAVFQRLMEVSPNPFSAFYRLHDKFLLCASPERFLLKQGAKSHRNPLKEQSGGMPITKAKTKD